MRKCLLLAVGLSLSFLGIEVIGPAAAIGCITFASCFAGVFLGNRLSGAIESKADIVGGIILVGIGAKILIEHLGGWV